MDQTFFPTKILFSLFHLNFTNPVREVDSINHAETVVTFDLYLNGKHKFE